jgi:hypothetical protein
MKINPNQSGRVPALHSSESKSLDAQSKLDTDSLYFQFLNNVTNDFPRAALEMMEYFRTSNLRPLWMARIQERINKS